MVQEVTGSAAEWFWLAGESAVWVRLLVAWA
jgi:hypothetical protein